MLILNRNHGLLMKPNSRQFGAEKPQLFLKPNRTSKTIQHTCNIIYNFYSPNNGSKKRNTKIYTSNNLTHTQQNVGIHSRYFMRNATYDKWTVIFVECCQVTRRLAHIKLIPAEELHDSVNRVYQALQRTLEFAQQHTDKLDVAARDFAFSLSRVYMGNYHLHPISSVIRLHSRPFIHIIK